MQNALSNAARSISSRCYIQSKPMDSIGFDSLADARTGVAVFLMKSRIENTPNCQ